MERLQKQRKELCANPFAHLFNLTSRRKKQLGQQTPPRKQWAECSHIKDILWSMSQVSGQKANKITPVLRERRLQSFLWSHEWENSCLEGGSLGKFTRKLLKHLFAPNKILMTTLTMIESALFSTMSILFNSTYWPMQTSERNWAWIECSKMSSKIMKSGNWKQCFKLQSN